MVLALDHAHYRRCARNHFQKEKTVKKGIAFFDFDGTITTKDTLLEFIKFSKGHLKFWLGFLLNSHYLLAYKTKIITNQAAKEKVLAFFFRGTSDASFRETCASFSKNILPGLIRPKALDEIRKLQREGKTIVVVSASPENWIREWTDNENVHLLASRLEIKEGKLTGRILGKNCHGDEKVKRITEAYQLSDYNEIFAYGDSKGDRPMLKLANNGFFRPFR